MFWVKCSPVLIVANMLLFSVKSSALSVSIRSKHQNLALYLNEHRFDLCCGSMSVCQTVGRLQSCSQQIWFLSAPCRLNAPHVFIVLLVKADGLWWSDVIGGRRSGGDVSSWFCCILGHFDGDKATLILLMSRWRTSVLQSRSPFIKCTCINIFCKYIHKYIYEA